MTSSQRDHWPQHRKASMTGPWDGPIGTVVPEDKLPRSSQQILDLARAHGWGFGPISLAIRLNRENYPPFFMVWLYDHESGRWHFDSSRAANGQGLNFRDAKLVLEHPDALLPEPPEEEGAD